MCELAFFIQCPKCDSMLKFWQYSYSDTIMMNMTSEHIEHKRTQSHELTTSLKLNLMKFQLNKIKHVSNIIVFTVTFHITWSFAFLHKSRDYICYFLTIFLWNLTVIIMKINEKSTENIFGDGRICYFFGRCFQFDCSSSFNH